MAEPFPRTVTMTSSSGRTVQVHYESERSKLICDAVDPDAASGRHARLFQDVALSHAGFRWQDRSYSRSNAAYDPEECSSHVPERSDLEEDTSAVFRDGGDAGWRRPLAAAIAILASVAMVECWLQRPYIIAQSSNRSEGVRDAWDIGLGHVGANRWPWTGRVLESQKSQSLVLEQPCTSPTYLVAGLPIASIRASSQYSEKDAPWKSLMDERGWAAADNDTSPWLEWTFGGTSEYSRPVYANIIAVRTKGRQYHQSITKYALEYTDDGTHWRPHSAAAFEGSAKWDELIEHKVAPAITARKLRLKLLDWTGAAAGRVELVGCIHLDLK